MTKTILVGLLAGVVVLSGNASAWERTDDAKSDDTPITVSSASIDDLVAKRSQDFEQASRSSDRVAKAAPKPKKPLVSERKVVKKVKTAKVISGPVSTKGNRALGKKMAAARGWTGRQWYCLERLWTKESNWRHTSDNPNSSAYGIPQALPGKKMASAGADWRTNPATQIEWGLGYIKSRYGSPCSAWSHFTSKNWY